MKKITYENEFLLKRCFYFTCDVLRFIDDMLDKVDPSGQLARVYRAQAPVALSKRNKDLVRQERKGKAEQARVMRRLHAERLQQEAAARFNDGDSSSSSDGDSSSSSDGDSSEDVKRAKRRHVQRKKAA